MVSNKRKVRRMQKTELGGSVRLRWPTPIIVIKIEEEYIMN